MTRSLTLATLLLLSTTTLAAQERWHVSVLATDIAETHDPWSDTHAGVGAAVAYTLRANWDVELAAAAQSYRSPFVHFEPTPGVPNAFVPVTEFKRYRVHPVDLVVTRHFLTGSRVSPYVRAGVRYVDAPDDPPNPREFVVPAIFQPVHAGFGFHDRTSAQAGAGVLLGLTPRTAVRVEVTRLLRDEEAAFDPLTRAAIGMSWKF